MSEYGRKEFDESYANNIKEVYLPQKLADRYHVVDCLKESEGKSIYHLVDDREQEYVFKEYDIRYMLLAENEYRIMKALGEVRGLSIPAAVDYWQDEKKAYILRRYVEGVTLSELYESGQLGDENRIISFSLEICALIGILHRQTPPIIHRDIKPENFIWNEKERRLYLIDCDSARFYKEGQERDTLVLGTPTHAAPEAYGYAQCDRRSDVFGIGKTIQYMCCGRSDDAALTECAIPKDLRRIITKCVEFSPKNRYESVATVEHDLKKLYTMNTKNAVSLSYSRKHLGVIAVAGMTAAFVLGIAVERYWGLSRTAQTGMHVTEEADVSTATQASTQDVQQVATDRDKKSLRDSASSVEIEVLSYQSLVDQIVIGYYEMDLNKMGEAYNALFTKLYAAEDLKALEWTDTSKLEEIPENYPYRPYPYRVCDPLACYDEVLASKIGDYEDYAGIIYGYLDFYLNEDTAQTDLPFYQYCTGGDTQDVQLYKEALVEVINCALRGVMDQDGLEFINP